MKDREHNLNAKSDDFINLIDGKLTGALQVVPLCPDITWVLFLKKGNKKIGKLLFKHRNFK